VKPISGKRMCRVLEKHGWVLVRKKSSHRAYRKAGHPITVIVPVHGNKDLKPGTQHGIMKDAGLSEDDL
jgi:predicted RNA binding protein YcfA (HicA-like mRNA interferase family)